MAFFVYFHSRSLDVLLGGSYSMAFETLDLKKFSRHHSVELLVS